MRTINYQRDEHGLWTKTITPPQCAVIVWDGIRCQGEANHSGNCWAYGPDGTMYEMGQGVSITGPWIDSWIHPSERIPWNLIWSDPEPIADEALIARLESGDTEDHETVWMKDLQ